MDIETLQQIRKNKCNCKQFFIWPEYHPESCPYRAAGMTYINKIEREYQAKQRENSHVSLKAEQ